MRDLAEYVFQTIHRTPQNPYIFAVDWAENQDQKAVVAEISKNFGSGLIKPKPTLEAVLDENFEGVNVGDKGLNLNLIRIVEVEALQIG